MLREEGISAVVAAKRGEDEEEHHLCRSATCCLSRDVSTLLLSIFPAIRVHTFSAEYQRERVIHYTVMYLEAGERVL